MKPLCEKHPHSSKDSARKCYAKQIAKRVDKRMGGKYAQITITRYTQVKCEPPEQVDLHGITVVYFYKGIPKKST